MSGLDNILNKISDDAKKKADEVVKNAEDLANIKAKEITDAAENEAAKLIESAEAEALRVKERISSGVALDIRNKKLAAKQESIEKVFEKALEILNDMERQEFEKFLMGYLKSANIKETDEIILPDRYKSIDLKKINPHLTLYQGDRVISGGFVLVSGGIERNNTFAALLDFYRGDLEPLIIQKLF